MVKFTYDEVMELLVMSHNKIEDFVAKGWTEKYQDQYATLVSAYEKLLDLRDLIKSKEDKHVKK